MGGIFNSIANLGRRINNIGLANKFDPLMGAISKLDKSSQNAVLGKPKDGRNYYGEGPLPPPGPPTQDVAANAAQQQQDMLRRRRGVLSNIFAGGNAPAPTTASKSALGN